MTQNRRLSVILPSYNDARIADAINSVRSFDDIGTVCLIIIDGGSKQEIRDLILSLISPDDVFISEPDRGIFDALNKGLEHCVTDFIGWLGSDDVFTGQLPASEVIRILGHFDLLVGSTAIVRGKQIRRITHGFPSRLGLVKLGLHNPHFSTFGRASLLKSERFEIDLRSADIGYFLRIFSRKPRVASSRVIATLMSEGGFSSKSYRDVLRTNIELISVYRRTTNIVFAVASVLIKIIYKTSSVVYFRIFKKTYSSLDSVVPK